MLNAVRKLRLTFEPDLEAEFRRYSCETTLRSVRLSLVLGAILVAGFGALDAYMAPNVVHHFWFIRFAIIIPMFAICMIASYTRGFARINQPIISGAVTATGLGIVAMMAMAPPPADQSYYAGLMLVLMYAYTVVQLRFLWATLSSVLILLAYEVVAIGIVRSPFIVLINNHFFFVSALLVGMLAGYFLELHSRRDFMSLHELKQARDQLQTAKERSEAASIAKTEFLANMSHEIRTPMTAIMGFTENLLDPDQPPADRLAAIHTVRHNGEHLLQIINDILDISKIEAGKMEVERIPCRPTDLVGDVRDLMIVRAQQKQISFDIEYDGALPDTIVSDPTRLKQVLVNLVGNAIKFTNRGGVRLITGFTPNNATAITRPATPMLVFEVVDSGVGMSAEQVRKLFTAFSQADSSTTRRFGGTGLGLVISKRLVELLGGDILVSSQPGIGTRVRIAIPPGPLQGVAMLTDPVAATRAQPATAPAATQQLECRVLLAEDNATNRSLIMGLLKRVGADVVAVENGAAAVETALKAARDRWDNAGDGPFDVILMDMQMPEMDGYEATRLLRQSGYKGAIVAVTAHAMASDKKKCLDAGCDDYTTKPINRAHMFDTIRKCLQPRTTATVG